MSYQTEKLPEEKVFKDPVHRYIHVQYKVIWDLIGTKEFQRLRRIKQLGTTSLTFHGAEHSRFSHSLGVYEIVRRIIEDTLIKRGEWKEENTLLALCAALLHDVGHGPFSHTFEKVFDLDHEKYTRRIILGNTEINAVLKKVNKNFPKEVAEIIEKTSPNRLVIDLISSQIDADRMDYLLRDAYFTGVSYGQFDMERILRTILVHENRIVFKESGMHAIEDYLMSRYQMYYQVYFHPVSRSAEVLLKNILVRVKDLYKKGYSFKTYPTHFIKFFNKKIAVNEYLLLDDNIVQYYFSQWQQEDDKILKDLCERFINRKLFKYISIDMNKYVKQQRKFKKLLASVGYDEKYYMTSDNSYNLLYEQFIPKEETNKLIEETEEEVQSPINLLTHNQEVVHLQDQSSIISAIANLKRKDFKLYFPEEFLSESSIDNKVKMEFNELLEQCK